MFDFETQAGVMQVLASVRGSTLSNAQKSELRDLVFLYTNGGHDAGVRHSLEQKLAAYQVQPVTKPVQTAAAPAHLFGTSRSLPQFNEPRAAAVASAPTPEPAPAPIATPAPTEPIPVPPSVEPAPAVPVPPPAAPQPIAEPVVVPPPAQTPEPAPAPTTPPATPTAVSAAPETGNDPDAILARIRDIKSAVNEKIGNPVNLVDINNEVGREYMAALLDAMKKINSGTSARSAMQRLEAAFVTVQQVIADHETAEAAEQNTEPSAPAAAVTPEPVPTPAAAPTTPEPAAVPPPVEPAPAAPQPAAEPVVVPPPAPAPEPVSTPEPAPTPTIKSELASAEADARWSNPAPTANRIPISVPAQPAAPTVPATARAAEAGSLDASKTKLRNITEVLDPASLDTSSTGDTLHTAEVDTGLEQLLVEWPIFKKSGLFGTGPKGRQHPLFLQIKDLQIPLLLSGRFDGSTQEIKQSITDYMNGWRYEQGILYKEGETFETYLRRVIRHILDLHKTV